VISLGGLKLSQINVYLMVHIIIMIKSGGASTCISGYMRQFTNAFIVRSCLSQEMV